MRAISAVLLSILACGLSAAAAAQTAPPSEAAPTPRQKTTHPTFERMKQLVGDWAATDSPDTVLVNYRLTGADSALIETLFPGSPHEMVTVYHLDGPDLVLTHYCSAGNQPRMKATRDSDGRKAVFEFTAGANIDPSRDGHIHAAAFSFVAEDHIQSHWTFWKSGKADHTKDFDLKRMKKS